MAQRRISDEALTCFVMWCRPQPAPLPTFSRRPVHLSPYAAYLAALAVICGT